MLQRKSLKELTLTRCFVLVRVDCCRFEREVIANLFVLGVFRGGAEVLLRAKLALSDGVTMQLTVRSTDSEVAEIVSSAIG